MPWKREEKNILRHYLFEDKTVQAKFRRILTSQLSPEKLDYINISSIKCIKRLENHLKKRNMTLLLLVNKIIKISTLGTKHCFFHYNGTFYKHI